MPVQHAFSNTVADGTNSSIVRPIDWNSYHNHTQILSGNTAGQSNVAGTNIVYAGGSGVTLSASTAAGAATISFNVATAPAQIAIVGNTSGTASTFTGDSFYLSGGNNITLSNNAGTIGISAGNGNTQSFQSFGFNGASNTANLPNSTLFLNYVALDDNITCNRLDQFITVAPAGTTSFTTSTNGNSSVSAANANSWSMGKSLAMYSQGTGTNSTRIESMAGSTTASMGATRGYTYSFSISSNSVTHGCSNGFSIASPRSINLSGGVTYTTIGYSTTASNTASSAAVITTTTGTTSIAMASTSLHTGIRAQANPWATSFSAGDYWLGMLHASSSSSSGTNSTVISVSQVAYSLGNIVGFSHIFNTGAVSNSQMIPNGIYSAATAAFPSTIVMSQINNNQANLSIPGVFMYSSLS